MSDDEKIVALTNQASDLFDELSIAGLNLISEDARQRYRKIFIGGYLIGFGQGHDAGVAQAFKEIIKDRKSK